MRIFIAFLLALNLTFGETMNDKNLTSISVNGVEIPLIFEISNALPLGNIGIVFYSGGKIYEDKVGLSTFSADMLNRGSKKRGEIDFANELESNAISLSVSGGTQGISFDLSFLKEKQDTALALFGELLQSPNMTKDAFNQSLLAIKSEILANENNFDYIAAKNLNKIMFKSTPLEKTLDLESIEHISLSDVERFLKNALVLENAVILVGGDLDIEAIKTHLISLLSHLPKGEKVIFKRLSPNAIPQTLVESKPTKQAYIYFASPFNFESYEKDLHKMIVMSFILGGSGFGSRVMEEIRVKRGLAYSAYFSIQVNNIIAYASGYLQTKLESKDEAIEVLRKVVSDFLRKGITQKELQSAKDYILGSRVLGSETLNQRLNKKFRNFNRNLPLNYGEILTSKIKNLSLEEMNSYIKSHSEVNNLSFSIVVN